MNPQKHAFALIAFAVLALLGSLSAEAQLAAPPARATAGRTTTAIATTNGVPVINGIPTNVNVIELKRAAEAGDVKAQTDLAMCFYDGKHNLGADLAESYKWATVAASRGHAAAKHLVQELELFASPKQLADGKKAAQTLIESLKKTGNQESSPPPMKSSGP